MIAAATASFQFQVLVTIQCNVSWVANAPSDEKLQSRPPILFRYMGQDDMADTQ